MRLKLGINQEAFKIHKQVEFQRITWKTVVEQQFFETQPADVS